jgi:Cdc6-like AAA superfamily ATPase
VPTTEREWQDLGNRVGAVFTPTRPVNQRDLFAGRLKQIRRVIDVVGQGGQHAIIFGERGVGKTSLANVISQFTVTSGVIIAPVVNCDASDSFSRLWHKVFRRIGGMKTTKPVGLTAQDVMKPFSASDLLTHPRITPDDVERVLVTIAEDALVILVVDEFDRLKKLPRRTFADTIKALSDHAVPVTIVLVGVADSVDQLIDEHQSVERALVQIPMPRMSPNEIASILVNGLQQLGMTIEEDARKRIGLLAQGLPHYAHLMGLHAARAAIDARSTTVKADHVSAAIRTAIDDTQQSIRSAYYAAIQSARKDNLFADVLLACALAKTDDLGYFAAQGVREKLCEIRKRDYQIATFAQHLNDFSSSKREYILTKRGPKRRIRYRFSDPLMQPFVVMQGSASGKVTPEQIAGF